MQRRLCLVTGASSGIGLAIAAAYARHGWDLALTARRLDRLEANAAELRTRHGGAVHVFAQDLLASDAVPALAAAIEGAGLAIDGLVNNAGFGLPGSFLDQTWEKQRKVLHLLLERPLELVHRFAPGMIARGFGRVVNVASVAGLVPGTAGHTLYPATKSALIRFSQSTHLEFAPRGVHVTALCPGFTYTEFHDVNGTRGLVSRLPKFMWLEAGAVAEAGYQACERNEVICVPGAQYKAITAAARLVPERLAFGYMRRQGSRFRRA